MAASNLTLVLPPLLFSEFDHTQFISSLDKNGQSLVNLRRILARGEYQSFDSHETVLTDLFGLPYTNENELPLAAIKAMGSGFDAATGYWFHAEPVHLHPDLDHILLFDSSSLSLEKNELGQLVEELQVLFEESNLSPQFGKEGNLFIRIDDKPEVSFSALPNVVGKNILQHLPEGKGAAQWRLLQNEIQMQMTQSRVNQRREERGLMTANGLWFWGEGYLLRGRYQRCYETVVASKLFVTGLATMTDAGIEKDINSFDSINPNNKTLVEVERLDNTIDAVIDMLLTVEQQWLTPAAMAIKKGKLETLTLVLGSNKISFSKKQQKRFWKRPMSFVNVAGLFS